MKNNLIAGAIGGWLCMAEVAQAEAIMWGWFNYALDKLGKPAVTTLDVYPENGLVLSRVGPEYAAFGFSQNRLTQEERTNPNTSIGNKEFVIEYEFCGGDGVFTGTTYAVTLKVAQTELGNFIEEYVNIQSGFARFEDNQASIQSNLTDTITYSYRLQLPNFNNVPFTFAVSKQGQALVLSAQNESVCPE